jgi:hypothetical protein
MDSETNKELIAGILNNILDNTGLVMKKRFNINADNKNGLYVRLHNFLVYLFIQRLSQHVSVVYDHHQVVFTCTLTSVFLLFLPTLASVYIWR